MTVALINFKTRGIVHIAPVVPPRFKLPTGEDVHGASMGWVDGSGTYGIVPVVSFVPPAGKIRTGEPMYAVNPNNNGVTETYAVIDTPLNVIPFFSFVARWTDAEYLALLRARANVVSTGNGGIGLVRQWDIAFASGAVDLNTAVAQNFKAALVGANILTQQRANEIFT